MCPKNSNPRNRDLRIGQAAALVKVSIDSLREWDRTGLLPAGRTAKGHRRYVREDLEAFVRRRETTREGTRTVDAPGRQASTGANNRSACVRSLTYAAPLETGLPWGG